MAGASLQYCRTQLGYGPFSLGWPARSTWPGPTGLSDHSPHCAPAPDRTLPAAHQHSKVTHTPWGFHTPVSHPNPHSHLLSWFLTLILLRNMTFSDPRPKTVTWEMGKGSGTGTFRREVNLSYKVSKSQRSLK